MFGMTVRACATVAATLLSVLPASAAKINISYTIVHDRLRPDPQRGVSVTNRFQVELEQSGSVNEDRSRASGRFSDSANRRTKLGDGWQVRGDNQIQRTITHPQSTAVLTITTTGKSCRLDVQYSLKPGFSEYQYRRVKDQTKAFFSEPKVVATSCAIQD